ncbi:dephospho-CoA kinase [candidate division KSB1 bacterium]|nr:dephospho-CoA kinase [candidate division KSB1 bacterium]
MLVVGLTGGIGTGKSEVSRKFAESGAFVLNADQMAHQITNTNQQVIQAIKDNFGSEYYLLSGKLDRKKLGQLVFSNPGALKTLNQIIHPYLAQKIRNEIQNYRKKPEFPVLIIEMAILFELKMEKNFDLVIVVTAPMSSIIKRLKKRDNLSQKEIVDRLHAQLPQHHKEKQADILIQNNSDLKNLDQQVKQIWTELLNKSYHK